MIDKVQKTLVNMLDEIPGVLTAAVVTISDGMSIAEENRKRVWMRRQPQPILLQ